MENIMVAVQLEQLGRTYGEVRKDGPPLNHFGGMLVRYNDVFTNVLPKKVTANVAHLSMRSARNTMGTRGTPSDTRDLWRRG